MTLAARDARHVGIQAGIGDYSGCGEPLRHVDDDTAACDIESVDEDEPSHEWDALEEIDSDGPARANHHPGGVVCADRVGA